VETPAPGGSPLNPYAPPASDEEAPRSSPPADDGHFRSLSSLATAMTLLMGALALANLVTVLNDLRAIGLMQRVIAKEAFSMEDLQAGDHLRLGLTVLSVALHLACTVCYCLFMPRANRNARSFGARGLEFTPRWAAGFFFVPVASLWKPYQAMKEIWQASDPAPGGAWQGAAVSALLPAWWATYILHGIGTQVSYRLVKAVTHPADFIIAMWGTIVSSALAIVAAVLALAVVRALAQRQDQRQRLAPTPAA
jgi:hypothetical protein